MRAYQKNCTKTIQNVGIQKFYRTLNLYISTNKSKFCMIMNVQQVYIKFLYIYKNVQTVQNLYKVQTKNSLKLKMYVFCAYKQCTNYTKPMQPAN